MSNPSPNAPHSPPQSPNLPDFTVLAAKLQETAQALLVFCPSATGPERDDADDTDDESTSSEKAPYQIRSYRLPGFILEEEQKMLKAYKADDWKELFSKVYEQLKELGLKVTLEHRDVKQNIVEEHIEKV